MKEQLLAEAHQKIGQLSAEATSLYSELRAARKREERFADVLEKIQKEKATK